MSNLFGGAILMLSSTLVWFLHGYAAHMWSSEERFKQVQSKETKEIYWKYNHNEI